MTQIRQARGNFAAMAGAYCLGAFNDNFFKQAVCLMAVYLERPGLQSLATIAFTLPWLLLAAPAGWLADRFPKRRVVVASKALELAAMLCAAAGILAVNWTLILAMVFLMALQSTIFSPALNGSIPELFPAGTVLKANSIVKMLVTSGSLVGVIVAGMVLKYKASLWGVPAGRAAVAAGVVFVAVVGLLVSLGVPHRPAGDRAARFPWAGPVGTIRRLWAMRRDRLLAVVVATDAFVWFVAVLQILIVNHMGRARFGLDEQQTSLLLVPELGGVALGGLLAGRLGGGDRWRWVLPPAMLLLGVYTSLIALAPALPEAMQLPYVVGALLLAGICGGVLLVPLESFFQIRPAAGEKGAVIAAANFAGFFGMLLAGLADWGLQHVLAPAYRFAVVGVLCVAVAFWLRRVLRDCEGGGND